MRLRASWKTPAYGKIDDFEASCKGSLGCLVPSNKPNPSRVGGKEGIQEASKGRFFHAPKFCSWLLQFVYFSILLAAPLAADLSLDHLSLIKAEEIALEYNKQFLIAREGTVEAKERKLQAISRYLPSIHYNAEFHQVERPEYFFDVFSPILPKSSRGYISTLQLDQPLLSTKLIFGLRAKQLEEQSANFEKANTQNELLLAVRDSYYAVILYDQALEIQRVNVGYLSEALLQEQQKLK